MSASCQAAALETLCFNYDAAAVVRSDADGNTAVMTSGVQAEAVARASSSSIAKSAGTHHLANLDALRAVAVCLVFSGHLMETAKIRGIGALSHFGVLLFLVHTALVLMLSMGSMRLSGYRLYGVFLIRRAFRIYPLSLLAVVSAVACRIPSTAWLAGYAWAGWPAVFSNLLLTQNVTHSVSIICVLWSLPFEVQMYAILPAIYLLLSRFPSARTAWLAWLAGIAIATAEYVARRGSCGPEFLLTRYFPCFLAGVLAWRLLTWRRLAVNNIRLHGWLWMLLLALLIAAYRAADAIRVYGPASFGALHGMLRTDHGIWWPCYLDLVNDWVFCGLTGLAIPYFANISWHWLNSISSRIAQYSYGIYVSHVPLLWLCFRKLHTGSLTLSLVLSLILTAIVSVLLYHCLENPAIQFGKRLTTEWGRHTALA